MKKNVTLDRFDQALVAELQRNNQVPARLLAERVGISESAVLRRSRRLRRDGVIVADVSIVSPAALGLPLTIHVLVALEREGATELDAFIRKIRNRSEVRHASYVTGDAEFVLLLQLSGMVAYDNFTREVFHEDANVKSFRTLVSIRQVVGIGEARPLT